MSYEKCKQCGFFPNECQCAIVRGQSAADRIASASDTITDRLCAEIKSRAERGVQKYGVTFDDAQLTTRQVLQHAKEEALDLAAYLERLIALEDRIAKAPKAWAVYMPDGTPFHVSFSTRPPNKYLVGRERIKRVALVEIPEEGK